MDLFIVLKRYDGSGYELEYMNSDKWFKLKPNISADRIIEVFPSLYGTDLAKYNFKEIIWGRVEDPLSKTYIKIKVPLFNNDVQKILDAVEEEKSRIYYKVLCDYISAKDVVLPDDFKIQYLDYAGPSPWIVYKKGLEVAIESYERESRKTEEEKEREKAYLKDIQTSNDFYFLPQHEKNVLIDYAAKQFKVQPSEELKALKARFDGSWAKFQQAIAVNIALGFLK